jgi:hypothetical protein
MDPGQKAFVFLLFRMAVMDFSGLAHAETAVGSIF